jgi:hypothetical protein
MRTHRLLAALLDLALAAGVADAAALLMTGLVWKFAPSARGAIPVLWGVAAAGALAGFLLRDAGGGRARRWLGLEAVRPGGGPPGWRRSVARNLPLLVPVWNLREAWPVLRDGSATRPADRRFGVQIRRADGSGG